MDKRVELYTVATSYGTGPFHPALRSGAKVMYWPNVTYDNEDEAFLFAQTALSRAQEAADQVVNEWNVYLV